MDKADIYLMMECRNGYKQSVEILDNCPDSVKVCSEEHGRLLHIEAEREGDMPTAGDNRRLALPLCLALTPPPLSPSPPPLLSSLGQHPPLKTPGQWEEYMEPIMEGATEAEAYDPAAAYPDGLPMVFRWTDPTQTPTPTSAFSASAVAVALGVAFGAGVGVGMVRARWLL